MRACRTYITNSRRSCGAGMLCNSTTLKMNSIATVRQPSYRKDELGDCLDQGGCFCKSGVRCAHGKSPTIWGPHWGPFFSETPRYIHSASYGCYLAVFRVGLEGCPVLEIWDFAGYDRAMQNFTSIRQPVEETHPQNPTLWLRVYKQYLLWALKYIDRTYFGLFGALGQVITSPCLKHPLPLTINMPYVIAHIL